MNEESNSLISCIVTNIYLPFSPVASRAFFAIFIITLFRRTGSGDQPVPALTIH
ncbi:MAG: hypothetical protein R2727_03205 [Bacteroidales bacterium]